jgi:hypothetical protein
MCPTSSRPENPSRSRRSRKTKLREAVHGLSQFGVGLHACLDGFLPGRRYLERGDRELLRACLRDFDKAFAKLEEVMRAGESSTGR